MRNTEVLGTSKAPVFVKTARYKAKHLKSNSENDDSGKDGVTANRELHTGEQDSVAEYPTGSSTDFQPR